MHGQTHKFKGESCSAVYACASVRCVCIYMHTQTDKHYRRSL